MFQLGRAHSRTLPLRNHCLAHVLVDLCVVQKANLNNKLLKTISILSIKKVWHLSKLQQMSLGLYYLRLNEKYKNMYYIVSLNMFYVIWLNAIDLVRSGKIRITVSFIYFYVIWQNALTLFRSINCQTVQISSISINKKFQNYPSAAVAKSCAAWAWVERSCIGSIGIGADWEDLLWTIAKTPSAKNARSTPRIKNVTPAIIMGWPLKIFACVVKLYQKVTTTWRKYQNL